MQRRAEHLGTAELGESQGVGDGQLACWARHRQLLLGLLLSGSSSAQQKWALSIWSRCGPRFGLPVGL